MAIQTSVVCDITDKELSAKEIQEMTICSILYRKIGKITHKNKEHDCVLETENFEIQIHSDKAAEFMERFKKLLLDMRK